MTEQEETFPVILTAPQIMVIGLSLAMASMRGVVSMTDMRNICERLLRALE